MSEKNLTDLHFALADHLDKIKAYFKPGAKVTLLVRELGHGDGGVLLSDDDPAAVIAEITKRVAAPPIFDPEAQGRGRAP